MNTDWDRLRGTLVCLAWWSGWACAAVAIESSPATIRLLSHAQADAEVVTIGMVAHVEHASEEVAERIRAVDLVRLSRESPQRQIDGELVDMRLRLVSQWNADWQLEGEPMCEVTFVPNPKREDRLLHDIRRSAASRMGVPEDELRVTLAYPLPPALADDPSSVAAQLNPEFLAAPRLGKSKVRVAERRGGSLHRVHSVTVEILRRLEVPIAIVAIEAGQELTADHVRQELRFVDRVSDHAELDLKEGPTAIAVRPMRPGEVVLKGSIRASRTQDRPAVLPRSLVRVVARRGGLTVTLSNAETLHAARIGEAVRVRNPSSGQVLLGRLTSPDEVQVTF